EGEGGFVALEDDAVVLREVVQSLDQRELWVVIAWEIDGLAQRRPEVTVAEARRFFLLRRAGLLAGRRGRGGGVGGPQADARPPKDEDEQRRATDEQRRATDVNGHDDTFSVVRTRTRFVPDGVPSIFARRAHVVNASPVCLTARRSPAS